MRGPAWDEVKRVLKENESGTKTFKTVKLPCGHGHIEITKPGDQWITCFKCQRQFLLTWSTREEGRRIKQQIDDVRRKYY